MRSPLPWWVRFYGRAAFFVSLWLAFESGERSLVVLTVCAIVCVEWSYCVEVDDGPPSR